MFPPSLLGPLYLQSRAKVATVMVTLRWEGEQGEPLTAVLGPDAWPELVVNPVWFFPLHPSSFVYDDLRM